MRVDDVLGDLDDHVDGNDHFEFFWVPHTGWALTKRNNRTDRAAGAPGPRDASGGTTCSCRTTRSARCAGSAAAARSGSRGWPRPCPPRAGSPTSTRATGCSPAPASCGSTRWSTPSRARRAPRRSTGSGASSRTPGCCSASRSRCASPPPDDIPLSTASGRRVVLHRRARLPGHGVPAVLPGRRADHGRLRRPAPLGQAPLPDGGDPGRALPAVGPVPGRARPARSGAAASPTPTWTGCSAPDGSLWLA